MQARSSEQGHAVMNTVDQGGQPGALVGTTPAAPGEQLQQDLSTGSTPAGTEAAPTPEERGPAQTQQAAAAAGVVEEVGGYRAGMQEVDALQNQLFEEEMERLKAVKRASEVEHEVNGKMEQLQDASKEMGVWEDTMGTLQLELESVIMRLANLKEQLRCKEEERDDILKEVADLEGRAVQKEEELRALDQLLRELDGDPEYVLTKPGRPGLLKGLNFFRKGSAGASSNEGSRMARRLSSTWSAEISELSPAASEEWQPDEGEE